MKDPKKNLANIAKNFRINPDEVLLSLWYHPKYKDDFSYIKNPKVQLKQKHVNLVKNIVRAFIAEQKKDADTVIKKSTVKLAIKSFDFSEIGKPVKQMSYITKVEVLQLYNALINDYPIWPAGVKHPHMLESSLYRPQTSFQGELKYPTIESAAAALMHSLTHNHPFHNGNKRISIVSMMTFLDRHGFTLTCNEDDLFKMSLDVATRELVLEEYRYPDAEVFKLAQWIRAHGKLIRKEERPITLRKLKQALARHAAEILDNGKIVRVVTTSSVFGFQRKNTLTSKVVIDDSVSDGREIGPNLVRSIREDLELTSDFGIDSEVFYDQAEFSSDKFVIKYKGLLKRLSKF